MSKVEQLQKEIQMLAPNEMGAFRQWFAQFDSDQWDLQMEQDIHAGKLAGLAEQALIDHRSGQSTSL